MAKVFLYPVSKRNENMITLAIESAISGGSISLLDDGRELAHWIGTSDVSRAEDLLVNIDKMLTSNNIGRKSLGMIAVSAGPGSFTGIRIGIATALGLKAGLGIPMSSYSALKAMAFVQPDCDKLTIAIPMGRNAVCLQSFDKKGSSLVAIDEPETLHEDAFAALVRSETTASFVLHSSICEKIGTGKYVVDFGANIANAIGTICGNSTAIITEPMFISKSF